MVYLSNNNCILNNINSKFTLMYERTPKNYIDAIRFFFMLEQCLDYEMDSFEDEIPKTIQKDSDRCDPNLGNRGSR
jgi:hypothetical protein